MRKYTSGNNKCHTKLSRVTYLLQFLSHNRSEANIINKNTTYWVFLFHFSHVKYGIKTPNMLCFLFLILASDHNLFASKAQLGESWTAELTGSDRCHILIGLETDFGFNPNSSSIFYVDFKISG